MTIHQHQIPTPTLNTIPIDGSSYDQMRATVRLIGKAINDASIYLPIVNRARALASRAAPKDYLGQLSEIYNDFVKRWRYVKDPVGRELLATSPQQIFHLTMGGRSADPGVGFGRGAGDCDDATIAIGAQLAAIGFPVRIATVAPRGMPPGRMMSHVFPQAYVQGLGWVTVDPVVYPEHGVFYTPPGSRFAAFDLQGNFVEGHGNLQNMSGDLTGFQKKKEGNKMNLGDFSDLSGQDDFDYSPGAPLDFRKYGISGFGAFAESMGMLDLGDCSLGLAAEADIDQYGRAHTPILEIRPSDYAHVKKFGRPKHGCLALGDDLEVYEYDQNLGFFKKLFKKIKKGVKKVTGKLKKVAKKLLKKIPGGKILMKLGKKIWKISKKIVAPLTKFVGKYAKKLAPVAALIPGYGPAIAAGLHTAGTVANLMNKHGVKVVSKDKESVGKLRFTSDKAAVAFKKDLVKEAKKAKKHGKKGGRKRQARPSAGGARPIARTARPSAGPVFKPGRKVKRIGARRAA